MVSEIIFTLTASLGLDQPRGQGPAATSGQWPPCLDSTGLEGVKQGTHSPLHPKSV